MSASYEKFGAYITPEDEFQQIKKPHQIDEPPIYYQKHQRLREFAALGRSFSPFRLRSGATLNHAKIHRLPESGIGGIVNYSETVS